VSEGTSQIHDVPEGLLYSEDHQWVRVEQRAGLTIARTGLTDYAQDVLGAVQFVVLPPVGAVFSAAEPCGEAEASKAVTDLYSPVVGSVVAVNDALLANPGLMNHDPYGEGWLYELQIDPASVSSLPLLDTQRYRAFLDPQSVDSQSFDHQPVQPPGAAPTAGASHG
jgi:glycine cleavage system H protein